MKVNSRDLDNYITGHYGADQFDGQPCDDIEDDGMCPYDESVECEHRGEDERCKLLDEDAERAAAARAYRDAIGGEE